MQLQYDISVNGRRVLANEMRGIEREFGIHQRNLVGQQRRAGIGTRGAAAKPSDAMRGFDQIARAARAADLRAGRERIALEKRVETQRLAGIRRAEAAEIRAAARAAAATQRAHAKMAADRTRSATRFGAGAMRGAGSGIRNVVGLGGGTLALAGGFGAVNAIREQMSAQAAASNLANQAGRPELKGSLLQQMQSQRGITAEQAAGGASAFQALAGDIEATQRALPMLSQLALASGANIEDLGAAAGSAFAQIRRDVSDPIEQMKRLADVMRLVAAQGQEGAIEIRDLGKEMPRLAGVASKFIGDKDKNLGSMAAFAQIAVERGGAANAAQAVSGVEAMTRQLGVSGAALEGMGVKTFRRDAKGKRVGLQDPTETVISALQKTGGDIPKLQKLFGEEGMRGIEGLRSTFVQAGGGAKGETAVRDLFARFSKTMSAGDVSGRAASRLADPDLQMQEATKKFNLAVADKLLPVVTNQLVPAMAKLAPHAASAAEAIAKLMTAAGEHPWGAVAAVIGGSIAKEIAVAKIGDRIARMISGGGGVPLPVGGGSTPVPLGTGGKGAAALGTGGSMVLEKLLGPLLVGLSMIDEMNKMTPAIVESAKMDEERSSKESWLEQFKRGIGKGSGSAFDVAMFGGTKGRNVEAERVAEAERRATDEKAAANMLEASKNMLLASKQGAPPAPGVPPANRVDPIARR